MSPRGKPNPKPAEAEVVEEKSPIEGNARNGDPLDANQNGVLDVVEKRPDPGPNQHAAGVALDAARIEEADDFLSEPVNQQEFNEFITMLARNAAEKVVEDLDERIRDLEQIVGSLISAASSEGATVNVYTPDEGLQQYQPTTGDGVPDYQPAHQGGDGTPWFTA